MMPSKVNKEFLEEIVILLRSLRQEIDQVKKLLLQLNQQENND